MIGEALNRLLKTAVFFDGCWVFRLGQFRPGPGNYDQMGLGLGEPIEFVEYAAFRGDKRLGGLCLMTLRQWREFRCATGPVGA